MQKLTQGYHSQPSIFILLFISLFIVGCKNVPPVTSGVGTSQITAGEEYSKYLQVHNPKLAKQLYISDIKSRLQQDLLEVNLTLTSTYKKTLQLQYQVNWFDNDGFAVEPGKSPWKSLDLHGMQTQTVKALAPTAKATTFSLYVREVPEKAFKF
ncbi:YcfL family protein [Colwellia sp. D2M02]|uniref:YcfL family protein n=1 Tax=Colwellia sp. D2M02 TaxID=2841562 RepID=UPI001C09AD57|nr:YcfL family protein [Colwellia sp. D2M02]MBU2894540.1 YcfL family protein [Colwellia sp. D2M02]